MWIVRCRWDVVLLKLLKADPNDQSTLSLTLRGEGPIHEDDREGCLLAPLLRTQLPLPRRGHPGSVGMGVAYAIR